ncbi:hypothetical protein EBZ80_19185 [bacterium]|nr:hypothetical protein [bacterium]
MIDLIHPFVLNGQRYTRLDRKFVELLVHYGRAHVIEALDELGMTPTHYDASSVRGYCQRVEDAYC